MSVKLYVRVQYSPSHDENCFQSGHRRLLVEAVWLQIPPTVFHLEIECLNLNNCFLSLIDQ